MSGVPGPNRHSTVLNVSDPRYSATYGNPYLRSPPKHSQYATYSTFSPSDTYHPVSYIASPASTNTVHSMVSVARSSAEPPPPPFPQNGHTVGGSIMGISNGSPQTHHRHPVTNDVYAVVSKPNGVMFRNGVNSVNTSIPLSSVPNYNTDPGNSGATSSIQTSPVTYIMDTNTNTASHTGTHV